MQAAQQRASGYSPADEIEKLSKLKASGDISSEEYERLKSQALAEV